MKAVPIPISTHTHRFSSNLHFFSSTLFFPIAQMAFLLHDAFLFILRRKKFLLLKIRRAKDFLFILFLFFFFSFLILEGLKRRGWSDYFLNAIDFFFLVVAASSPSFTN
jgi:hypothetical protein